MKKQISTANKKLTIISRLVIFCLVLSIGIFGSLQVFAAPGTYQEAIRTATEIQESAEAMLIANAFKKCVKAHMHTTTSGTVGSMTDIFKSDTTNVGTGVWLELKTQGKIQNGDIYCNQGENLADLFADALGISKSKLLCSEKTAGAPGLLAKATATYDGWGVATYFPSDSDCGTSGSYMKAPNADAYLEQLWKDHKKASWPSWDMVGNYVDPDTTGMYAYHMYRKEYDTFCKSNQTLSCSPTKSSTYSESECGKFTHMDAMTIIGTDGSVGYRWDVNKVSGTIKTSFVDGGNGKGCVGLVDKINQFAPYYENYVKKLIFDGCKNGLKSDLEAKKAEAKALIDDPNTSDEQRELAQKKYDEIKNIIDYNQYTKVKSNGGLKCVEVEGVKKIVVETPSGGDEDDPGAGGGLSGGGGDEGEASADDPLGGTPGTTVEEDPCYANAGSLGWIMCPVITSLDGVLSNFYDTVIEKFLKIEINAAFDNDSATHTAWSIMRDIANIAFVVMLLVVILSQLTGFGIDNYGIKRTLPRIIIAAILVNASFIACQIVIDMSNIIGLSLRQMLENLAPEIKGQPLSGAATIAGFAVETGLGVAIIVLIAKFSVDGWWGIVLVALLAVLAIVIAVFFLFIVLITRQAALIMLVVIAPLAFVCYLLPNTEKLFKKWIDAIKGLLLLYPICSIVVGGGAFAGRVLASVGDASGNWIYSVAAMLIQVMPFFLIPSLTRSSLKGIGNIGEKIGAAGKSFSRAARGTIGNAVRGSQTWRGHHERRGQMLSDNYQDRMMDKSLNANKRGVKIFGKTIHGRNSLMARVAKRDENGKPMKHADGSYVIDTDKLSTLSTSERKMLLAMQARKRDNETIDSRIVSGGHRISPDSIAAQRAQYRAADQAQEVKDKEAQIVDGSFRYDVNINGQTEQRVADPNDIGSLQEALRAELRKDESEVDTSKVKALQNVLSQKGDKGRTAVTEAMTQAQADVAAEHAADSSKKANVSHKARQAYSENINDHWASDYKNNQRSTYEFAQANSLAKQQVTEQVVDPTTGQTTTRTREETDAEFDARIYHRGASEARQDVVDPATGQTRKETDAEYSARLQAQGIAGAAQLSAFQSGNRLKYDSLRANQLADMDDNELERFIRQADANQFQQIQTLAMDALADDSSTNLKTERQRLLANIANMSQADIASNTGGANGGARRNDFNHLMNSPVTSAQIDAARQKAKDRAVLRVQLHNPGGSP